MMVLNKNILKHVSKMYKMYKASDLLSAAEYINSIQEPNSPNSDEIGIFLSLTKHRKVLEEWSHYFLKNIHLSTDTKIGSEIILFIIVFILDVENFDIVLEFCKEIKSDYLYYLVAGLINSSNHLFVCQIACKYFDNEYIFETILDPFLNKIPTIFNLGKQLMKLYEIKRDPSTKPVGFSFTEKFRGKRLHPPTNTPAVKKYFKAVGIPKSTWQPPRFLERNILKSKEENRKRAQELLLEASKVPKRLTEIERSNKSKDNRESIDYFKSKPIPTFKKVEVKSNLTTTLREASRVVKQHENEVKNIDDLVKGGFNNEAIEKLEEQLRKEHELRELQTIEKNHLKGLLSYEEAILAKHKLLETNKEKMEKFKEEKIELLRALDLWREQEEEKVRSLVEKSNNIKQNAKESERKMLERKQENVRIQQYETKQMLNQASADREKELTKKMQLIQEIKALHRVRCDIKQFDPTEAPNLGLLCEMSIAELQERLAVTKMNMKKELEEKRQSILRMKEEHKRMIENVKQLIEESRSRKPVVKPSRNDSMKFEESADVLELRKQLEEKRKLRSNLQ